MKKLFTIFTILTLCILNVSMASGPGCLPGDPNNNSDPNVSFSDPELKALLDAGFPTFDEDLIIVGSFLRPFSTDLIQAMLSDVFTRVNPNLGQFNNANFLNDITNSTVSAFGQNIPCENFAVVISLDRKNVTNTFQATNVAFDASKNQFSADAANQSQVLGLAFESMTGNDIQIGDQIFKVAGAVNFSPIMLDLNGDNKPDTNRNAWTPHAPAFYGERTAIFDMSGDNSADFCEWPGAQDALLVLPESDGSVKNACNLFGTAGGYKNGYEKMALVLDQDKNGCVEGEELNGLYLWQDANANARVDKGEMRTVQSVGVEKINVTHNNYNSTCVIKGKELQTWDWWPCCYELMKVKK